MSATAHLSSSIDFYELYLSNKTIEDNLDEQSPSSASEWKATLEPAVDIANLLWGKSDIAQAKVKQLNISSLPLCFSKTETIKVFVNIPSTLADVNQYYNTEHLDTFNKEPYTIRLIDLITSAPIEAVTYLDDKLSIPIIHFILRSTLRIVLDTQIFNDKVYHQLSLNDCKLILAYLDATMFSRLIIHNYLCKLIKVTDNIKKHVLDHFTYVKFPSKHVESTWLKESSTIQPPEKRPQSPLLDNSLNLTLFYDVKLKNALEIHDSPRQRIETETARWLQETDALQRTDPLDDNSPLTDTSIKKIEDLVASNKQLIQHAIKSCGTVSHLEKHINKVKVAKLQDYFIKIDLNQHTQKLQFFINPKPFLVDNNSFVTIDLPDHCSHSLGADVSSPITLTITHTCVDTRPQSTISNQITHPDQTLAFPVRPIPRVVSLISNLCSTLKRDHWLKDTRFSDFQMLSSIVIDESCIDSQHIFSANPDEDFHRLNNAKSLLSQFDLCLLDGQFRKVLFQKKTYMSLQLVLSPYTSPY